MLQHVGRTVEVCPGFQKDLTKHLSIIGSCCQVCNMTCSFPIVVFSVLDVFVIV